MGRLFSEPAAGTPWPKFDVGFGHSFQNMTIPDENAFFNHVRTMTLTWGVRDSDVLFLHDLRRQTTVCAIDWCIAPSSMHQSRCTALYIWMESPIPIAAR